MRLSSVVAVFTLLMISTPTPAEELCAVGLFEAKNQNQLDVQFIALGPERANVLITNETDKPMLVSLPDVFAGRPLLGQFGAGFGQQIGGQQIGGAGGQQGQGFGQGTGGGQQVGGGFGQGAGNGNNFGGLLRIAPGKTRKVSAKTVCLEHGKPNPKPKMAYEIAPLSEVTSDPVVAESLRALASGKLTQNQTQAIAWHRENDLTWNALAAERRSVSRYVGTVRMFLDSELDVAKRFVLRNAAPEDSQSSISENTLAKIGAPNVRGSITK